MGLKRITLDTDILVCAFDANEGGRREQALKLLDVAGRAGCLLALQVVGEFYESVIDRNVLNPVRAYDEVERLLDAFETFASSSNAHRMAARQSAKDRFSYRDGLLLASGYEAQCSIVLSGKMKDGDGFASITARNPFGAKGLSDAAKVALGV